MKNDKPVARLGLKVQQFKIKGNNKNLQFLSNRSKTENEIPILWQLTAVKSIYKGGVKEKIQENQIGMFLVNIISKISDESVLKIQNENKNENISQIEITGRKQRSAVDNLIILN